MSSSEALLSSSEEWVQQEWIQIQSRNVSSIEQIPHDTLISAMASLSKTAFKPARKYPEIAAWEEHMDASATPPLKIEDYTSPPDAATPDPEQIIWTPSKISGPVTVEDACRLYCITPDDIRDLSDYSCWIDLPTVAKRALTLHGGFHAHMELVRKRREEEEEMLFQDIPDSKTQKSSFRFSPMILKQWVEFAREDSWDYASTASRMAPPVKQYRVAVFYPTQHCDEDNWRWEWLPDMFLPEPPIIPILTIVAGWGDF
ncbi:hypothetical protein DFH07DRAFT_937485 [Mycena maculata]|uniref:Uncharacterized protein n=1 Tax=Mycena maculata TaxID=230809 RepID=A0AAD7JW43_9AGAR|nr:hypothetical protein DFH07DRAFT_937485 [Mycena maculata]